MIAWPWHPREEKIAAQAGSKKRKKEPNFESSFPCLYCGTRISNLPDHFPKCPNLVRVRKYGGEVDFVDFPEDAAPKEDLPAVKFAKVRP